MTIDIRSATDADFPAIWRIFHAVAGTGDTDAWAPDTSQEDAHALRMSPPRQPFVALSAGHVVGTCFITPNQPGLGSHVAHAGFMVDPAAEGRGIGRRMGEHALDLPGFFGPIATGEWRPIERTGFLGPLRG